MQSPTSYFDKISPTALMVAYARQFTDIPHTTEIAELVDAQSVVDKLLAKQLEQPVELAVLIEGRYKAINEASSQFNHTQIIELASGLLPRGMIMSENADITFVESDLPAMISRKQQIVKQLIGDRSNLHFTAIDATHQPSQFPLHTNYLNPHKPVTIFCEGLLMYLNLADKQQLFANIREILELYGGVWITSDLNLKDRWAKSRATNPNLQKIRQMIDGMVGTSTVNNYFDNLDTMQDFANQQGFSIEQHNMINVQDKLSCLEPLAINRDVAEYMLTNTFVSVLRLKDA